MGDEIIDIDLTVHVPIDDLRHVGTAARTAKGRPFPGAPGDQLERTGCIRAGRRDADNDAFAPSLMGAFKRGASR